MKSGTANLSTGQGIKAAFRQWKIKENHNIKSKFPPYTIWWKIIFHFFIHLTSFVIDCYCYLCKSLLFYRTICTEPWGQISGSWIGTPELTTRDCEHCMLILLFCDQVLRSRSWTEEKCDNIAYGKPGCNDWIKIKLCRFYHRRPVVWYLTNYIVIGFLGVGTELQRSVIMFLVVSQVQMTESQWIFFVTAAELLLYICQTSLCVMRFLVNKSKKYDNVTGAQSDKLCFSGILPC